MKFLRTRRRNSPGLPLNEELCVQLANPCLYFFWCSLKCSQNFGHKARDGWGWGFEEKSPRRRFTRTFELFVRQIHHTIVLEDERHSCNSARHAGLPSRTLFLALIYRILECQSSLYVCKTISRCHTNRESRGYYLARFTGVEGVQCGRLRGYPCDEKITLAF